MVAKRSLATLDNKDMPFTAIMQSLADEQSVYWKH